jgi:hypothetical protein
MKTKVKGLPTAVVQSGKYVQIWCSSPDGDSSDSQILEIRCANDTQATVIYEAWCEMVWADNSPAK